MKINTVFPQDNGPQTAINNMSVVQNIFILSFGFGRLHRTVQEGSENQNVHSMRSRKKNINFMREKSKRNSIIKIFVKYTTSD